MILRLTMTENLLLNILHERIFLNKFNEKRLQTWGNSIFRDLDFTFIRILHIILNELLYFLFKIVFRIGSGVDGNGRETFVIYLVLAGGEWGGGGRRMQCGALAVITHTNMGEGGSKNHSNCRNIIFFLFSQKKR